MIFPIFVTCSGGLYIEVEAKAFYYQVKYPYCSQFYIKEVNYSIFELSKIAEKVFSF